MKNQETFERTGGYCAFCLKTSKECTCYLNPVVATSETVVSHPPEEQKVEFETWLRGRIKRYKKEAEEMYGAGMADNSKSQNDAKAFKAWADSYAEIADELEETLSEYLKHTPKQKEDNDKITRVEVIDYLNERGRTFVHWDKNSKVELSYQDDGKTLKIFIEKRAPKAPEKEGGENG